MIVGIGTILVFDVHSGRAVYDDTYGVPCGTHLSDSRSYDPCASRGITHSRTGDTLAYIKPHRSDLSQPTTLVLLDIRQSNAFLQLDLTAAYPLLLSGYSVHSVSWQYGRLDLRHNSFRQTSKLYTPKSASQSFASNDRLLINVDSSGVVSVFDQGGTVTRTHTLTGWQPTWNMLAWTTNTGLLTQVSKANGYIRTWNTNGTLLRELRYPTQLLANTFVTNISARVIIAPYFNGALYWSEGFDPHILSINDNILFDSNTPGPEEHHNSNAVVEFFTLLGQRINPIDTSIHRTLLEVRRTPHRVTSTLVCHSW